MNSYNRKEIYQLYFYIIELILFWNIISFVQNFLELKASDIYRFKHFYLLSKLILYNYFISPD